MAFVGRRSSLAGRRVASWADAIRPYAARWLGDPWPVARRSSFSIRRWSAVVARRSSSVLRRWSVVGRRSSVISCRPPHCIVGGYDTPVRGRVGWVIHGRSLVGRHSAFVGGRRSSPVVRLPSSVDGRSSFVVRLPSFVLRPPSPVVRPSSRVIMLRHSSVGIVVSSDVLTLCTRFIQQRFISPSAC
jgi:hypothetical protein